MKKILLPIIAIIFLSGLSNATSPYFNIYRNDGDFNRVELSEGTEITHSLNSDPKQLIISNNSNPVSVAINAIDSCLIRTVDIPSIYISFPDYPDVTQIWDKELYLNATMRIEGNGYTDDAEDLTLQVKGRGNTTWGLAKKPMRLKFPSKTSICGFKKAKNYVLLADYLDFTHLRNPLSLWIADKMGLEYTNHFMPCNVYINNNYTGLFLLTEKIGINAASVDIDDSKGALIEMSTEYDEDYKFKSACYDYPVMIKDPDFGELAEEDPSMTAEERLKLWETDFNYAEQTAYSGNGSAVFDVNSCINYLIVNNIAMNHEIGWPKSVFLYKRSLEEGEVYHFGPCWDFDTTYNSIKYSEGEYIERPTNQTLWINAIMDDLCNNERPEDVAAYQERFNYFYEEVYPEALNFIDEYAKLIEPACKMDGVRWPESFGYSNWTYRQPSYDTQASVASFKRWFTARVEYLKQQSDSGAIF